ncbi:hypothetical protein [Nocardia sp. NPDC004860]|uniref:hypothetical protein n=1 Tax=Nocardia sp. NPDC004860 TaxID=3154557 RepID=UPI0033AFE412
MSSTQIDRQERLAREQTIRADRLRAYTDFGTAYMDLGLKLGELRGVLGRPANNDTLQGVETKVQDSLVPYQHSLAMLYIVMSSSTNKKLNGINAAMSALWEGPDSLAPTFNYASTHQIATDENWPRLANAGVAAIDKFVNDTAIDNFVEAARKDLGSG